MYVPHWHGTNMARGSVYYSKVKGDKITASVSRSYTGYENIYDILPEGTPI